VKFHDVQTGSASTARQPGETFKKDGVVMIVLSDGDVSTLAAAQAAGLVPSSLNPSSPAPSANGQQESQPQTQQDNAADAVAPQTGDVELGQIAMTVGDSHLYAAIQHIADGGDGLGNIEAIAQLMGKDLEDVRAMSTGIIEQYRVVADAALEDAGVIDGSAFLTWARSSRHGELSDALSAMVSHAAGRSTSKLKALGREFVKQTGGGISDAALSEMALPEGASWERSSRNELVLNYKGERYLAQAALRSGMLKFS
jgi:hypothetical protein